jgi:hypothetical protein
LDVNRGIVRYVLKYDRQNQGGVHNSYILVMITIHMTRTIHVLLIFVRKKVVVINKYKKIN